MKKLFLFTLVLFGFAFGAQASSQDCPLKNMKANQGIWDDGTAVKLTGTAKPRSNHQSGDVNVGN